LSQARGKPEVTVRGFYVATLLFAANVAVYLKVDRAVFLGHAGTAFDRISRENSRRRSRPVDPGLG
jgi:hypothetical protein